MFKEYKYNQDDLKWNVFFSLTNWETCLDLNYIFINITSFWNVSNVIDMSSMFESKLNLMVIFQIGMFLM